MQYHYTPKIILKNNFKVEIHLKTLRKFNITHNIHYIRNNNSQNQFLKIFKYLHDIIFYLTLN